MLEVSRPPPSGRGRFSFIFAKKKMGVVIRELTRFAAMVGCGVIAAGGAGGVEWRLVGLLGGVCRPGSGGGGRFLCCLCKKKNGG